MMPAQPCTGGDSLTRTTLLMDDNLSPLAMENAIAALKRVPGVLLAELGPGSARAIVAHDAAVANASLLEAAAKTGVHVTLAAGERAPATSDVIGQLPVGKERERLLLLVAAVFLGSFVFSAISPRLANSHMLFPIIFSFVWVLMIARAISSRRS
jgi:hypothetical protein